MLVCFSSCSLNDLTFHHEVLNCYENHFFPSKIKGLQSRGSPGNCKKEKVTVAVTIYRKVYNSLYFASPNPEPHPNPLPQRGTFTYRWKKNAETPEFSLRPMSTLRQPSRLLRGAAPEAKSERPAASAARPLHQHHRNA